MINALRAEVRKLCTVRSTYVIFALTFALAAGVMSYYGNGFRDSSHAASSSAALLSVLFNAVSITGVFLGFSAILSVGHEYRYNTILYTLTNTNNRLKVFFGKWIVLVVYALLGTVVITLCSWLAFYMGQHGAHVHTMAQSVPIWDFVWRSAASTIAAISYAYLITMLARSLVVSFAAYLVIPAMVENLLGLLLKGNVKYLPFTAASNLTGGSAGGAASSMTPAGSLQIVILYVVVVGALAAFLFTDRDAN